VAAEHVSVNKHGRNGANLPTRGGNLGFGTSGAEGSSVAERRCGDSDALRDTVEDRAVVLPGFVGKTEETKEDKRAYNDQPTSKFQGNFADGISAPDKGWDLINTRVAVVGIGPADIWLDTGLHVEVKGIGAQRNGAEDLDSGKAHETNITAGSKVVVAGKHVIELGTTPVELDDAPNYVIAGNEANEDG